MITSKNVDGVLTVSMGAAPCNEIGTKMLAALEGVVAQLADARVLLLHSTLDTGFCAGADLRELFTGMQEHTAENRDALARGFLERIHAVMNAIDTAPIPTIAAVHGVCFGGGFELALACDLIIADKSARFAFPELRLGLIPGFGGIPRLKRDTGNALIRDILLTGRSINAKKALETGLASQVVGEGHALRAAQATAAQMLKFDAHTAATAKRFIKPDLTDELAQEIEIFLELLQRPAVVDGLRRFVESDDAQPYLP